MIPRTSLASQVCDFFKVDLDSEDFFIAFDYSLSYLTGGVTAFQFQEILKPVVKRAKLKQGAQRFRLSLIGKSYNVLNLKLYLLRFAAARSVNKDFAKDLAEELNVYVVDARRILSLWKDKRQSPIRKRLRNLVDQIPDRSILSVPRIQSLFDSIYKDVFPFVKSFVGKKMYFIHKYHNVDVTDTYNDVMVKLLITFYKAMPTLKNVEHLKSSLRKTARNHVLNMIDAETCQKRGRFIDSHTLGILSENHLTANNDEFSYDEIAAFDDSTDARDLALSVRQVLGSCVEKKKVRFLLILMGNPDAEFTEWLQERKLCKKKEDNVDLQLRTTPEDFNRLLGTFLKVPERKVILFLTRVGKKLAIDGKVSMAKSKDQSNAGLTNAHQDQPVEAKVVKIPTKTKAVKTHGKKAKPSTVPVLHTNGTADASGLPKQPRRQPAAVQQPKRAA
jgi:DNA-directed RNA polymerase specialized sigma24 family protein